MMEVGAPCNVAFFLPSFLQNLAQAQKPPRTKDLGTSHIPLGELEMGLRSKLCVSMSS